MTVDLYCAHFGFRQRPFKVTPDRDFLFMSRGHARALAILEYGLVTRAPVTLITGEVGTGKTTLIQALLAKVENDVTLGLISNAQGDRGDLLRWLLNALNVPLPEQTDYVSLFQHFQNFVIEEYAQGRRVVLIIDEAQNLGPDMLEELRLLTNINSGKDELLQLILTGQPELRDIVSRPDLRQFAQRVTATFHLSPFTFQETLAYIQHRLKYVSGVGDEFTLQAIRHIHEEATGIPRMINKLCDLALVYAASADQQKVTLETIQELFRDGLILKPAQAPLVLTNRIDIREEAAE